ncbi:MAG: hypothetical protein ABL998_05820 [Planctomycetota bacterium]
MSELRETNGATVDFTIVEPADTAARADELARYNLTARKHGTVAFDAQGEPIVILGGHSYGKAELEMALAQIQPK